MTIIEWSVIIAAAATVVRAYFDWLRFRNGR